MGDPTAVYSSIGIEGTSKESYTVSAGMASGNHLGAVDLSNNKSGNVKVDLTYAYMVDGKGFYGEGSFTDGIQAFSVGGVTTWKIGKRTAIYPIAMLGASNVLNDTDPTATVGGYWRTNLGDGFQIGADVFYSLIFEDERVSDGTSVEAFLGYQYKNHRFRVGYSNDHDDEIFINYKIAL